VLNDAISIYFADATLASAFVVRWCAGSKVEAADGVFRVREDEPVPRWEPGCIGRRETRLAAGGITAGQLDFLRGSIEFTSGEDLTQARRRDCPDRRPKPNGRDKGHDEEITLGQGSHGFLVRDARMLSPELPGTSGFDVHPLSPPVCCVS
jgi:hypothetical protein